MEGFSLRRWVIRGAVAGVVMGLAFALFEMAAASAMGDGFWMPLRMIGAIVLGESALEPTTSLGGAAVTGAVLHTALSAAYGAAFGALAGSVRALRTSSLVLVLAGTAYGLGLWLVNFYVVSPLAFEWFGNADPLVQFVAHVLVFGAPLGAALAWVARGEAVAARAPMRAAR